MKVWLVSLIVMLSSSVYASSELNQVAEKQRADIEQRIMDKLFGTSIKMESNKKYVGHVRQIGQSNNYLLKLQDPSSEDVHTLTYLADVDAIIVGDRTSLIRLDDKSSISQEYQASYVKPLLANIDSSDLIDMSSPESAGGDKLYVFTDPTCGYCNRLHREIAEYQQQGLSIQYLPYPRSGKNGAAYKMLVNAYCSKDRKSGLDYAKANQKPPQLPADISASELQKCEDIVNKYLTLGAQLGISGTPSIYTVSGYQVGGYVPAAQLRHTLDQL